MKFQVQITDDAGNIQHYVINHNPGCNDRSLDDFILEALWISEEKRKLPLKIECPNGLEVYPSLKMKFKGFGHPMLGDEIESMHISWQG
jgi:hypothetical protein